MLFEIKKIMQFFRTNDAMVQIPSSRRHSTSPRRLQCDLELHPTPSVLSRFLGLYWTAEYKERVTIKHVHSNTQYVTVSNTNTPFAIEGPGAETTRQQCQFFTTHKVLSVFIRFMYVHKDIYFVSNPELTLH